MSAEQQNDLQNSRTEKRLQQIAIRRRNRIIGNIMMYTGLGLLVLVCVMVIFILFKGQAGQEISSLKLNEVAIDVRSGYSLQLHPVTEPKGVEYALSYISSDEAVISVSGDGVITAHKVGTATITVSSGDKSAKCVVTVKPDTIDTLTATSEAINIAGGDTVMTPFECYPPEAKEKDIVFKSYNPDIATVDEQGYIKGIQSGEVSIEVKDNVTGKFAIINVLVAGSEKATSIEFTEKSITLEVGEVYNAQLIFNPPDIVNTSAVYYTTSKNIASVTNEGVITAKGEGVCVIEAIYEMDTTLVATMEVTVIDPFVIIGTGSKDEGDNPDSGEE